MVIDSQERKHKKYRRSGHLGHPDRFGIAPAWDKTNAFTNYVKVRSTDVDETKTYEARKIHGNRKIWRVKRRPSAGGCHANEMSKRTCFYQLRTQLLGTTTNDMPEKIDWDCEDFRGLRSSEGCHDRIGGIVGKHVVSWAVIRGTAAKKGQVRNQGMFAYRQPARRQRLYPRATST